MKKIAKRGVIFFISLLLLTNIPPIDFFFGILVGDLSLFWPDRYLSGGVNPGFTTPLSGGNTRNEQVKSVKMYFDI